MIFAAIVLMAGFSTTIMAQTSAEVAATPAGAVLIVPMGLVQDAPLHFGSITMTATLAASTVTLPSNSITRVFTGTAAAAGVGSDPAMNAAYSVTGTHDETYALTLPGDTDITLTETGTGAVGLSMTVTAFTARFNTAGVDATTSTLSATGTDNFTLGATLNIPALQTGGVYAGTFPVIVDYN